MSLKTIIFSLLFFSILGLGGNLKAMGVTIHGNNPDYARQTIELFKYTNYITSSESRLFKAVVDSKGDFTLTFDVSEPTFVFMHQGIFFVYLYAEPGMDYTVKLPPATPKKQEERLNPFFEEERVHLLLLKASPSEKKDAFSEKTELNNLIRQFDSQYDPIATNYAIRVYSKQDIHSLDSVVKRLSDTFDYVQHPYFRAYCTYRIGLLKFTSTRYRSRNISDNYFLNKPVLYENVAYMELFNEVYDKYFVYFGRTPAGKQIYTDINLKHSLSMLQKTLLSNVLTNDTLREFVILKGLHDGFYEMEFSREAMLQVLDSLNGTTRIPIHKAIGEEIRQKVTKLMVGYAPPPFKLLNSDSVITSLADFKGQYVYLNFCTTKNYACLKELEQLKWVREKYGKYVKIVSISVDESLSDVRRFVKKSGYKWTFLHYGNQPDILKEYDIRAFPTYYLVDPQGKLTWSPAPSPNENFESKLFEELKAKGKL
jgi:peroxiredoxin